MNRVLDRAVALLRFDADADVDADFGAAAEQQRSKH